MPIIPKRRVQFSRIDPEYARELFIRHALVEGEWDSPAGLRPRQPASCAPSCAELEERTRRRDILYDDEAVFDFYDRESRPTSFSTRSFEGWWRKATNETPDLLTMTPEALVAEDAPEVDEDAFRRPGGRATSSSPCATGSSRAPRTTASPSVFRFPCSRGVEPDGFDWQVPGLRTELVTAMIKSLPQVHPAQRRAGRRLGAHAARAPRLPPQPTGERPWSRRSAATSRADPHLRHGRGLRSGPRSRPTSASTFSVVDERGRADHGRQGSERAAGELKPAARESVARVVETPPRDTLERTGVTSWDFDALDRARDTKQRGGATNTIRAYPALVDRGSSVEIRLMSTPEDQAAAHRAGVRRLLLLAIPSPLGYVQEHLTTQEKLTLAASPVPHQRLSSTTPCSPSSTACCSG